VARSLKRSGLTSFIKRKKPLLTEKHKRVRLAFAKKYQHWTVDDWKRVVFSDETMINRWGSGGRQYGWKKLGAELQPIHTTPTLKHGGGSIMVWSCFCAAGPGYICYIDGNMTAQDYCGILESDLLDSLEYYSDKISNSIFQHDNDPKHTAKLTLKWLEDSGVEVLDWPSQSSDLNPIEHMWSWLKKKLQQYQSMPRNKDEIWERVVETWYAFTAEECARLVESMPKRLEAVIKARGGHTKY
jgi:hypothetical protein